MGMIFWIRRLFLYMKKKDFCVYAFIIVLYIFMELMGITCPIRFLTGVSCAGCGMSRAWLSLLRGDLAMAFYYHPLFLLPIPAAIIFLFKRKLPKPIYLFGIGLIGIAFIVVYIIRLICSDGYVVAFDPVSGAIARLFNFIRNILF